MKRNDERKKVVVACDSFKGSLGSAQAGEAVREGILRFSPQTYVEIISVSDGGEGLIEAVLQKAEGELIECEVSGPSGVKINASYGVKGNTAVIEIAKCCGLTLLKKEERNPALTTTYGVGELIKDALDRGYRRFLIGLGGSATNDAGVGMLQALGYKFKDNNGDDIARGGLILNKIIEIEDYEIDERLRECEFIVACDVTNPLTGPRGASYVFGPQKGADADMVSELDKSLRNFAFVTEKYSGTDNSGMSGAGAAGGLGFAFISFLRGELRSGVDIVLDAAGFDEMILDATLVITGEGKLDSQTLSGKLPYGVLKRAKEAGVQVIAIGGTVEKSSEIELLEAGFQDVIAITPTDMPLEEAMKPEVAAENIRKAVFKSKVLVISDKVSIKSE